MEGDILLENNVAEYVPELQIFASNSTEEVGCIIGGAAEVSTSADSVVSDIQSEGARFGSIESAVADASLVSVIVLVSVGVPVFAEYAEVLNRNNEVCAPDAVKAANILCFVAGEVEVSCVQFSSAEVISATLRGSGMPIVVERATSRAHADMDITSPFTTRYTRIEKGCAYIHIPRTSTVASSLTTIEIYQIP